MSRQHKNDELALKRILKRHVSEVNIKLELLIYYKSLKITNLLIKNNISNVNTSHGDRSHIVYEFTCNKGECNSPSIHNSYIGLTTMTLRDRMSAHRYQGSIFRHFRNSHGVNPLICDLLDNSKILYYENDPILLGKYEALHIRRLKPSLHENISDFRCLKLNIF